MPTPSSLRVLVVDDHVDTADSLAELFGCLGMEVRVAYSGPEALQVALEFQPEAVIADIRMPGMTGAELCRCLQQDERCSVRLYIAHSGQARHHLPPGEADCFTHYLLKPSPVAELLAALGCEDLLPQKP
jgi:CheY-like chemotaxis protein